MVARQVSPDDRKLSPSYSFTRERCRLPTRHLYISLPRPGRNKVQPDAELRIAATQCHTAIHSEQPRAVIFCEEAAGADGGGIGTVPFVGGIKGEGGDRWGWEVGVEKGVGERRRSS